MQNDTTKLLGIASVRDNLNINLNIKFLYEFTRHKIHTNTQTFRLSLISHFNNDALLALFSRILSYTILRFKKKEIKKNVEESCGKVARQL